MVLIFVFTLIFTLMLLNVATMNIVIFVACIIVMNCVKEIECMYNKREVKQAKEAKWLSKLLSY